MYTNIQNYFDSFWESMLKTQSKVLSYNLYQGTCQIRRPYFQRLVWQSRSSKES